MFFSVHESSDYKLYFTMKYAKNYSTEEKQNTAVLTADVSEIYFYAKTAAGVSLFTHTLGDHDIAWKDGTKGKITVNIDAIDTEDKVADANTYELKVKLAGGEWIHVDAGTFDILESDVDTP